MGSIKITMTNITAAETSWRKKSSLKGLPYYFFTKNCFGIDFVIKLAA
jgi:hypothetical protein